MYPTRKRWALAMGWVGLAAGCAGVPLVKESLNNDPGALLFNGYSNPSPSPTPTASVSGT